MLVFKIIVCCYCWIPSVSQRYRLFLKILNLYLLSKCIDCNLERDFEHISAAINIALR